MICHDHRCIFIHVPKVAGKSVEQVFLDLVGVPWEERSTLLLRKNDDPALGPERLAHLTAREYVECGHVAPEEFDSYFKFAFVRNPWARLVSEYRYRNISTRYSFKDFLLRGLPEPSWRDTYRHIMPQYDFLYDDKGDLLVDFVGRFERLQQDFDIVCQRLGIPQTPLPHIARVIEKKFLSMRTIRKAVARLRQKEPQHGHYTEYYDSESREIVARMYAKDIEAFGYGFE